MFCYVFLQGAFALLGLLLLAVGRIRIGQGTLDRPMSSLVGLVLLLPVPVSVVLGLGEFMGNYDEITQTKVTKSQPRPAPATGTVPKYVYIDLPVTGGFVLLAGLLAYIGVKNNEVEEDLLRRLSQLPEPRSESHELPLATRQRVAESYPIPESPGHDIPDMYDEPPPPRPRRPPVEKPPEPAPGQYLMDVPDFGPGGPPDGNDGGK